MGFMVLIWVIWEIAGAIRGVFRQAEQMENDNAGNRQQQGGAAGANQQAQGGAAPGNAPANPNAPVQPGGQVAQQRQPGANNQGNRPPNTQDVILNHLSQVNIQDEARFVEPGATPNVNARPPTFLHKIKTFFLLLILTLHPAIWDRRRATLREREGRIRDEARTREARIRRRELEREEREENRRRGVEVTEEQPETEIPPIVPKPFWVAEYAQRVRSGDWADDS